MCDPYHTGSEGVEGPVLFVYIFLTLMPFLLLPSFVMSGLCTEPILIISWSGVCPAPIWFEQTSDRLVVLFNQKRKENGLRGLYPMDMLVWPARHHALMMCEMRDVYQPDIQTTHLQAWCAGKVEANVGVAQLEGATWEVAQQVVDLWMADPDKRKVVLTPSFRRTGCGMWRHLVRQWVACFYATD